jgi:hypothetical protein
MVKNSLILKKEFSSIKLIVIVVAIIFPFFLIAQNQEKKRFSFGANFGIESSNVGLFNYWQQGIIYRRIWIGKVISGPSFGGFAQYSLSNSIVFRAGLNSSFTTNEINFKETMRNLLLKNTILKKQKCLFISY